MQNTKRKSAKGFTLLEVMAVLVILGILAGIAAKNIFPILVKGSVTKTKGDLHTLHEAVEMFRMDAGRYPTDEEGLTALVEQPADVENWASGGYLKSTDLPRDGWHRDFIYLTDPGNGKPFVIISYGADGEEGGEGEDADLWSTDAE